jgi:hypothetical protein
MTDIYIVINSTTTFPKFQRAAFPHFKISLSMGAVTKTASNIPVRALKKRNKETVSGFSERG